GRAGESHGVYDFLSLKLFVLRGQVLHKGQALSGVFIDGGALGKAEADDEGRFSFPDVPEGTVYALVASREGYVFHEGTISGELHEETDLTLQATQLFDSRGKVLHHGKPLAG